MNAAEYLRRAQDCMEIARSVQPDDKPKLFDIADAWLRLARVAALNDDPAESDDDNRD